ncbi:MAG: 50S ribosomal protein L29 [SAR202 cluster bacterium]|nr:50S ribosomal protein L29 [SAR202 cluster bacterium]
MRIHDVRALSDQQLKEELEKNYKEVMNLRFRAATNQLPNTNLPRTVRKDIARILTVLRERELGRS